MGKREGNGSGPSVAGGPEISIELSRAIEAIESSRKRATSLVEGVQALLSDESLEIPIAARDLIEMALDELSEHDYFHRVNSALGVARE